MLVESLSRFVFKIMHSNNLELTSCLLGEGANNKPQCNVVEYNRGISINCNSLVSCDDYHDQYLPVEKEP